MVVDVKSREDIAFLRANWDKLSRVDRIKVAKAEFIFNCVDQQDALNREIDKINDIIDICKAQRKAFHWWQFSAKRELDFDIRNLQNQRVPLWLRIMYLGSAKFDESTVN